MATKTTNYELWMPESTDNFSDFLEEFNENMETIDENMGGGSGSSGHTIVDENGSDMPSEDKLQFAGNVTVADDSQNGKTVVTIGSGGGGFVETTTANYEALPDAQKLDPTKLYMLNDTPPTEIPVDFSECVNKKASRMSASVVDGALVWTYSGSGGQVSANSFYPTAIPKEAEKLVISLSTGTAYNASTFEIGVGVRATYQDTSYVYSNDSNWLAIATYNQTSQNNVELEVDLSNVTDDSYLVIACFGWNVTFNSIVVKLGGTPQYQTSMRYKDFPYANGQGSVWNVYGAFIDTDRVIKATTTISGVTTVTYTATEDCVVTATGVSDYEKACEIKIDNVRVWRNYNATNSGGIEANSTNLFLRKGQVISVSNGSSQYNGNYTVYGIKQGTNGIFAPVIYSDTERKIGVWRDNKPLYQKTYSGLSLVCTNANQSYPTNVDWGDIEEVVHSDIIDQYGQSCVGSVVYTGTPAKLAVYMQMANRTVTDITIQYTKTTDSAGSGNWNTDGVPTVHYSTSEQVVGTWLGKPLYQNVLTLTQDTNLLADTWVKTEFSRTTMQNLIKVVAVIGSSGAVIEALSGGFIDDKLSLNSARNVGLNVADTARLIVQYTKTTD